MQGRLRDYWLSLGEYRQRIYYNSVSIDDFLTKLHNEFLGSSPDLEIQARKEYMNMKCYSLKRKHLQQHYDAMSKRYYQIHGIDEVSLKYVFLQSFPEPLGQQAEVVLKSQNLLLPNATLGNLYQAVIAALDRLCDQRLFFKHFKSLKLGKACGRSDLIIRDSFHKKRKKFRKAKFKARYFKRRVNRGKKKGDRCFICRQKGHFAKKCPRKASHQNLIDQYCSQNEDLESLYEEEGEEPTADSIFCIREEQDLSCSDEDLSLSSENDFHMMQAEPADEFDENDSDDSDLISEPLFGYIPIPATQARILTHKYAKPFNVIAFFDTGAAHSVLNPDILPPDYWKKTHRLFRVASGETMAVTKLSKPIYLKIFPDYMIKHRFYGTKGPGKDVVVGFDLIQKMLKDRVIWMQDGLKRKGYFEPWSSIPKIFSMTSEFEAFSQNIVETSCAESHSEFLTKCQNPLWFNPEFFIKLPFKMNEDINPTKATHFGMHPDHQKLAEEELAQLKSQGIVEETSSPWACQAFYVNKRAEQVRGKLRLVIDYKPLNLFLADLKFPLPRREVLLQKLPGAKIFSKFDLKAGFWQLGIHPAERYKTAFCIPNFHYQWTVMPFGLKNAPSEFQKAMTKIFEPILHSALVYIDDILLFSSNPAEHMSLLRQFHDLVLKHGIMLSQKKMQLVQPVIDFLGLVIQNGQIRLQPHIATKIQEFPDTELTVKQVQQFLGLVNYMKDFIPQIAQYRSCLSQLLQKSPPSWTSCHTDAVKKLKELSKDLPTLHIPSADGQRILQTDASDHYWGAVLLESNQGRKICGYQSGKFKPAEQHYHSTFKEILAVKKAIEKFKFHLIGRHFLVEMDMSAFPAMLNTRKSLVPHPQLVRWKNWFEHWKFDVRHIKGKTNFLPDFLSRPTQFNPNLQLSNLQPRPPKSKIVPIYLMEPDPDLPEPPNFVSLPMDLKTLILTKFFKERMKSLIYACIVEFGLGGLLWPMVIHPEYPYFTMFDLTNPYHFPSMGYALFRNLIRTCTIGCLFEKKEVLAFLNLALIGRLEGPYARFSYLAQWLSLFKPLSLWRQEFCDPPFDFILILFHSHWFLELTGNGDGNNFREHFHYNTEISTESNFLRYPWAGYEHWRHAHATVTLANGVDPASLPNDVWLVSTWLDWSSNIFPPAYSQRCQNAYHIWEMMHLDEVLVRDDNDGSESTTSGNSGPDIFP